ncbi:hypothetical protein BV210_10830 [Halorientalis sp. IM1011]|uniref:DUF4352 domain-containing protein n=1 Tax=Halorientalis sp. IM1011 TaxID=1932360 RepID=UPI00097CCC0B|nr:DUF4352 domain-containing protein [Halorientalis sp. IM1011]AQL43180.1 hypothetical protein BV210_10830 [Halorientalis sp. IM1011]
MTDDPVSRRALLRTGVVAGSLALAGCSGDGSTTPTGQPGLSGGTVGSGETTGDGAPTDDAADLDSERPSTVVGQRILDESVGFLVEGVDRRARLGGEGEAPSGKEYLVVVLSVKNRGDEALEMSDLTDFRLTDGDGTTRERLRLVSQTGSQFTEGLLVPGETIRGFVAFEVAADSQGWSFVFDVNAVETDFERVTVDLDAEPQRQESRFRQSLRVPVEEVGAEAAAADLTVTVSEVRTADSVGGATAGEGREYLFPTVRIDNAKDRTAYLGLVGQTLLTGARGTPQALDLGVQQQLDAALPLSPNVPSGEHVEGEIPYVVDAGASPLYFSFDFTSNGADEKAIWQLR